MKAVWEGSLEGGGWGGAHLLATPCGATVPALELWETGSHHYCATWASSAQIFGFGGGAPAHQSGPLWQVREALIVPRVRGPRRKS